MQNYKVEEQLGKVENNGKNLEAFFSQIASQISLTLYSTWNTFELNTNCVMGIVGISDVRKATQNYD